MLQELVRAFAAHTGVGAEYMSDIEGSDGVFGFTVEGETICTIYEVVSEADGQTKIALQAALNREESEDRLLDLIDDYSDRLRHTPLCHRGYISICDDMSVGFTCETDPDYGDAKSFCHLMDLFVATVRYLVRPEPEPGEQTAADAAAEAIFDRLFVPVPDLDYHRLLAACNIDEKEVSEHYGNIYAPDGFAAFLSYHDLSGLLTVDNAFDCDDGGVILDLVYGNGMMSSTVRFEYTAGSVHLISHLDPRGATPEDLNRLLITHRFWFDAAQEYVNHKDRHIVEFDLKALMNAMMV